MKIEAQPPSSYITFIKNELSISESAITEADKILNEQIESEDLAGKNPAGIAAAAVYLGSNVTQKEVGDAVGLSSETIRKRVDELKF
jgi:transcription initiation factor TFIIB